MDDSDDLHPAAGGEVEHDIGLGRTNRKGAQSCNDMVQAARAYSRMTRQQIEGLFDHIEEPIGCPWVASGDVGCVLVDILGCPPSPDDFHRRFLAIDRRNACRRLAQ